MEYKENTQGSLKEHLHKLNSVKHNGGQRF